MDYTDQTRWEYKDGKGNTYILHNSGEWFKNGHLKPIMWDKPVNKIVDKLSTNHFKNDWTV